MDGRSASLNEWDDGVWNLAISVAFPCQSIWAVRYWKGIVVKKKITAETRNRHELAGYICRYRISD